MSNPCVRCGKERINGKKWEETIGLGIMTHTKTICPDSACQKMVEQAIAERIAKNDLLIATRAKAKLERVSQN